MFTVFGGDGFIGSHFVAELKRRGHRVFIPVRGEELPISKDLGIVVYSAGYGNCEADPYNVLDANTSLLSKIVNEGKFSKLVYISSTRVYLNQDITDEDADVTVSANDGRRLFNLTKLTSEEICLRSDKNCLIVRPSNVYGLALDSPLFLPAIIRDAINNKKVNMYVTPSYSKDYVFVGDVVNATIDLIDIDCIGIVNIASGENIKADTLSHTLIK